MDCPNLENAYQLEHAALLADSYQRWLGKPLMADVCDSKDSSDASDASDASNSTNASDLARQLFEASFVLVSHDTATDPIFNYGNATALQLFEMSWSEFTQLPSRKSAEPVNREERARLLAAVTSQNYIDDYAGVRISSTGKRFFIPQATVWNVVDEQGIYRGQAACFSRWTFLTDEA